MVILFEHHVELASCCSSNMAVVDDSAGFRCVTVCITAHCPPI